MSCQGPAGSTRSSNGPFLGEQDVPFSLTSRKARYPHKNVDLGLLGVREGFYSRPSFFKPKELVQGNRWVVKLNFPIGWQSGAPRSELL